MDIYVFIDGKTWGPLSREDVEESLTDGRLLPDHLAWHEARSEWIALPELLAEIPVSVAAEPVAVEAEDWAGTPSSSLARGVRSQNNQIEGMTHRGQIVSRGTGSHEVIPEKTPHDITKDHKAGIIFIVTLFIFALIGGGLYALGVFEQMQMFVKGEEEKEEEVERTRVSSEWRRMYLAGLSMELPFTPRAFKLILDPDMRQQLYEHEGSETRIGDVRVMLYQFMYRSPDFDPATNRETMARLLFERMGGEPGTLQMAPTDVVISDQPTEGFTGDFDTRYGPYKMIGASTNYKNTQQWTLVAYRVENMDARPDAERVLGSLRLRAIELGE